MGAALGGPSGVMMIGSVVHHNNHKIFDHEDSDGNPVYVPCDGHGVIGEQKTASGSNVLINGKPAVLVGDTGEYSCACHGGANVTYTVSSGSSTVFVNGKPLARSGDTARLDEGSEGTLLNGSSDVFVGG